MRALPGGWLAPGLALLAGVALWGTAPDRSELREHVAARAFANQAGEADGVFARLAKRGEAFQLDADPRLAKAFSRALHVFNATRERPLAQVERGGFQVELAWRGDTVIAVREPGGLIELPVRLPTWGALLAPWVAILVALALRRTALALYGAVFVGAVYLRFEGGAGVLAALAGGAWDVPAHYLRRELVDSFRIELIGFTFALIAMVGVMIRGSGVQGFVGLLLRLAGSVRSTLAVSFGLGLSLFFDDYSNCLIVGNTMRPLTDRLRISREKLAYIVDSTAAPVAGLSLLSTWVVFEVSTYSAQLPAVGITDSAYAVFLQTIPFRFYCLFSLGFVALNILTGRDFGPMRRAQERAATTGEVVRAGGAPLLSAHMTNLEANSSVPALARNALLPIAVVIAVTVEEIFRAGGGFALLADDPAHLVSLQGITGVLFKGGGAGPLMTAASCGWAVATFLVGSRALRGALLIGAAVTLGFAAPLGSVLALWLAPKATAFALFFGGAAVGLLVLRGLRGANDGQRLGPGDVVQASVASIRALGFAVAILFGAWMMGAVCSDALTGEYLAALTARAVPAGALPALLFLAACLVSFATGTSWGTMAILLPNVVALAADVGAGHPVGSYGMVVICIGAVLEGSIFGDHCSPISDTTVLSSVATAADHLDHVRTQAPYALFVAALAIGAGYLPSLWIGWWSLPIALAVAGAVSLGVLYGIGRPLRASMPTDGMARGQEETA